MVAGVFIRGDAACLRQGSMLPAPVIVCCQQDAGATQAKEKARFSLGIVLGIGVSVLVDGARDIGSYALALRLRRHNGRSYRFFLERVLQNLVQRAHVGDLDVAENLGR